MAFAEDFSSFLQNSGIAIDASEIPSADDIQRGLDKLKEWLDSLEPDTRLAVDEVTADFPAKVGLADSNVNIAPELVAIFRAADNAQINMPISGLDNACRSALKACSISDE